LLLRIKREKTMVNHKGSVQLETERLILRKLKLEDAPTVFRNWASDKEVTKFLRWNAHADIEVTEQWIKECEELTKDKSRYEWGIVLKEIMEPIGSIGAFKNTEDPDRYEIGYALGKKFWGHGYATEAFRCVINFLANEVGIKHFRCSHAKENPASGAVMRHVGFVYKKDGVYQSFDGLRKYECKIYHLDIE